jgi:hypothetical protein
VGLVQSSRVSTTQSKIQLEHSNSSEIPPLNHRFINSPQKKTLTANLLFSYFDLDPKLIGNTAKEQ